MAAVGVGLLTALLVAPLSDVDAAQPAVAWTGQWLTDVTMIPSTPEPGETVALTGGFTWPSGVKPNDGSCRVVIDGGRTTAQYQCQYTAAGTVSGSVDLPADIGYGDHLVYLCGGAGCGGDVYYWTDGFHVTVLPALVPDVRCLSAVEAVSELTASGFSPDPGDDALGGWVTSQDPAGDTPHEGVSVVAILTTTIAETPNLVGMDYDSALAATDALCLTIRPEGETVEMVVVEQRPTAAEPIEAGAIVYVEMGPEVAVTPPTITPPTTTVTRTTAPPTPTLTAEATSPTEEITTTEPTESTPPTETDRTTTTAVGASGGGGDGDADSAGPLDPLSGAWQDNHWLIPLLLVGVAVLALAGGRVGRTMRLRQDRSWVATHVTVQGAPAAPVSLIDPTSSPPERPDLGMAFVAVRRLTTTHIEDLA